MKKSILKFVLPALVFGVVNFGGTSASAETVEVPTDIKSVISTNFEQPETKNYDVPRWHRPGPPPPRPYPRPPHPRPPYPPPPPHPYPPGYDDHRRPGPRPPYPPPPRHRSVENVGVNTMPTINDNVAKSDTVQS